MQPSRQSITQIRSNSYNNANPEADKESGEEKMERRSSLLQVFDAAKSLFRSRSSVGESSSSAMVHNPTIAGDENASVLTSVVDDEPPSSLSSSKGSSAAGMSLSILSHRPQLDRRNSRQGSALLSPTLPTSPTEELRLITLEELRTHKTREARLWLANDGIVYDVSDFYHPGGEKYILQAAGCDATSLIRKYHSYVNVERYLKGKKVGRLASREPKALLSV